MGLTRQTSPGDFMTIETLVPPIITTHREGSCVYFLSTPWSKHFLNLNIRQVGLWYQTYFWISKEWKASINKKYFARHHRNIFEEANIHILFKIVTC